MFGTLLESRALRRRRPGGAAVSVAVHVAIIGAVTATTVHGIATKPEKPEATIIHFDRRRRPLAQPMRRPRLRYQARSRSRRS